MDRCSYFIDKKALFGSHPTQRAVEILESQGVRYFIDLTCPGESKITPYITQYTYIRYPIRDHRVPTDWGSFATLILRICNIIKHLKDGEMVYIHCKGGHGRSGVVVACTLCQLYKIPPTEALHLTTSYHFKRVEMREKWRRIGSPQSVQQKTFVHNFFRPIYFYKPYSTGPTAGMSNFSIHSVEIKGFGLFPTAEAAFHAHKDPTNEKYIKRQEASYSPRVSKKLGRECNIRPDWDEVKDDVMILVLDAKFAQHQSIRDNLLSTGLRPIIEHGPDSYWGDGKDTKGKNMLGKFLVRLRNKMYVQ
jgi:ribA/ribD-fused uncharacterized protein